MTYYIRSGAKYMVSQTAAIDINETLPIGTYTVGFDQMAGAFYLEQIEDFEINGKIYGDTKQTAKRVLNTFFSRDNSTGVLLSGEKGSGKTLLAKMLSLDAMERGVPTIVINQNWAGEGFNNFMQMISQPTVVIFDEFEKVYDNEDQEKMLTLLDGVYPSKKLFLLTSNDDYRVNKHMKNRPGRIFYAFDYKGLSIEFIREYCEDNLLNKTHIDSMCRVSTLFGEFNFDMLKAMVEEMNRYDESPQEVMKVVNAKPSNQQNHYYDVGLVVNEKVISGEELDDKTWYGSPLSEVIYIDYFVAGKDYSVEEEPYDRLEFRVDELHGIDPGTGKFTYVNAEGARLTLSRTKEKEPIYNVHAF